MAERLQKLIAKAGLASRRQAEKWIEEGRVSVNGHPAKLGDRADLSHDQVQVDGKDLAKAEAKLTILLNKPRGYVSTLKDPEGRRLVTDLLTDVPTRLFPVGRLDYNTEGLLLLTNDGDLAYRISHPSHNVDKTYLVKVRGLLSAKMVQRLEQGIHLDEGVTAPAKVDNIRSVGSGCWFELTIHEGRNRQVRRMCEVLGLTVVRLKRIRLDSLDLVGVSTGRYRVLSADEVRKLEKT
ncbi:ribosomal large subunit pseudouridine synthase B [Desulfuromusa kysingii]|uniref:Pseudouridine synthase n=1 Tax=Desulfuromusa kysingii TaxID=37625 RepID=A0A1H4CZK8_9BACT|nr:pseudouridine synthase [Desulfuromusa kysingii]SEA65770.1 ribosomal large subunit pseudouridine synthase B [Desulfuromusa kysingii]